MTPAESGWNWVELAGLAPLDAAPDADDPLLPPLDAPLLVAPPSEAPAGAFPAAAPRDVEYLRASGTDLSMSAICPASALKLLWSPSIVFSSNFSMSATLPCTWRARSNAAA